MGCRPRCFNPSLPTRHAAGSSLHQRGEPRTPSSGGSAVPHTCHMPGSLAVSHGHWRVRQPNDLDGCCRSSPTRPRDRSSKRCMARLSMPPAGPQAQGWTGKCKSGAVGVGLGWGFILSPSVRTGPSRLGPAGEGRSDGRVLHLHPRGQACYPEGGRRREDDPPGEGWRVRANAGDDEHQGDEDLENSPPHSGLPPRAPLCMAPVAPLFHPLPSYADAAGSSLHQRGGTPHPTGPLAGH